MGQWSFKLSLNDLVRTAERPDGVLMLQARQRVPHKHQTPHEATLHCDQQLGPGSQQVQSGKCSRRSREPNSKGKGKSSGGKKWCCYKSHAQQRSELSCLWPWGVRPAKMDQQRASQALFGEQPWRSPSAKPRKGTEASGRTQRRQAHCSEPPQPWQWL